MPYEAWINVIPHSQQRYNTVGDYQSNASGFVTFHVSSMGDWRYEFLVALHEMIEQAIVRYSDVSELSIDEFDKNFEGDGEPGDDPEAPYYEAHQVASAVEKMLSVFLGVKWRDYEDQIDALEYKDGK